MAFFLVPVMGNSAVTLTIPDASGDRGQTGIAIPVNVSSTTGQGIISYDLTITYDSTALTAVSVTAGTLTASGWTVAGNVATPGIITIGIFSGSGSPMSGAGSICTLNFNVKSDAPGGDSDIVFTQADVNEGEVTATTVDGTFTVNVPTYSIAGTVTLVGGTATRDQVDVTLSRGAAQTVHPNGDTGVYTISNVAGGLDYTVTPTLANYTFNPTDIDYDNLSANQTAQDYTGTYNFASVAGTISYSGSKTGTIHVGLFTSPTFGGTPVRGVEIEDPTRQYTITEVPPGTYYAAAYRGDTAIDTAIQPYGAYASNPFALVAAQAKTGVNITLTDPTTYSIAGTVTISGASPVTSVLLTLVGPYGTTTTNPETGTGAYSFTNLPRGNYTLTPTLATYTFDPVDIDYTPLNSNQTNQDFTAIPPNFNLTVVSAQDTPNPSVGVHAYPQSTSVTASVTSPAAGAADDERFRCIGWAGTGNVPLTGTTTTTTFTILADSSITWNWKKQYRLMSAVSPVGGGTVTADPPSTGGWYDEDAENVTFSQQAATDYIFNHWEIDDGTNVVTSIDPEVSVAPDDGKVVTAVFLYNQAQLGVNPTSVSFLFINGPETKQDSSEPDTNIVISNTGSGLVPLSWEVGTITYGAGATGWVTVLPESGELAAGETEIMVLTADKTGLPVGTYTATVPITSNGGNQNISVTMTIAEAPTATIIYPTDEDVVVEPFLQIEAQFDSAAPIARSHWEVYRNVVPIKAQGGGIPGYQLIYQTDVTGPETTIQVPWALFAFGVDHLWTVQCWESVAGLASNEAVSDTFGVVEDQTYNAENITGQALEDIQTAFADVNPNVQAALHEAVEGETVVVAVDEGLAVRVRSLDPSEVEGTDKPDNVDYLLDVRVDDVDEGETVVVTFYLPGDRLGDEWFKYNSVLDSWAAYPGAEFTRTITVGGQVYTEVELTLVDGGAGDFDGLANGTIVDPSGVVDIPAGGEVHGGGGGCFIATAAFGSYQEYHVWVLRQFRDNFLLTNAAGKAFVGWYYRHSPKYAAMIAQNDALRAAVRTCLLPVYAAAYLTLKFGAGLWLLLAALVVAFALRRRSPAAAKLMVAAGILLLATPSFAVDFNHFKTTPGEKQFLVNSSAQALKKGTLQADVFYTYADKPGLVKLAGVDRAMSKDQNIVMLSAAYAFTDKLQASIFVPLLAAQSSDPFFTGVKSGGIGNVTLAAKYSFCGGKDKIGFAVAPFVALPTGNADNLISSDSTAGGFKVVVDKNWNDRTFLTLNVGYWGQSKEEIGQITVSNGVLFGAGISQVLPNGNTSLSAEIYGRSDQGAKGLPLEAIVSVGQQVKWAKLIIGGGAGLNDGYGAPYFRGFVGVKMDWPLGKAK